MGCYDLRDVRTQRIVSLSSWAHTTTVRRLYLDFYTFPGNVRIPSTGPALFSSTTPQRALRLVRSELVEAVYSAEVTLEPGGQEKDGAQVARLPYAFLCQRLRERSLIERKQHETAIDECTAAVRNLQHSTWKRQC